MDFLNYWDTRIDANERFFNANPGLAIECAAWMSRVVEGWR